MSFLQTFVLFTTVGVAAIAPAADAPRVDTSTIIGKVVTGYQGWFRCEGDGSNNGWHHYGAKGKFEPGFAGIEMWPDVSELGPEEKFATGFRHADGSVAYVFSSVREATVRRHFEWMRDYGIDGAFLQRFAVQTRDKRFRDPMDQVLAHCRASANATGRGWTLMYDLTGLKVGESTRVIEDWKRLVDEKRVAKDGSDAAYFRHRGKPLVSLWGLGFKESPLTLDEWSALITFFKDDAQYGGCAVMLGVPYYWRTLDRDSITDPKLHELIARADIVSPWAVGRLATPQDAANRVEKNLKPDVAWCHEQKVDYLPVIFPGFSWVNLSKGRGQEAKFDAIPRRDGDFL
ncbi:MAG TPA: glycoside hydrolase family 71/99-like protein [Candidatus Saccharimonadia bacterium]|nr:glycoside hydrolase family 71/99-like protein [Candidatus Saccharimonadia bacterium]